MENPTEENQLNIELPEEMAEGHYVNLALIAHSPSEFVMDFMTVFPPKGIIGARVIISPGHAKRLLKALQTNIAQYEKQFGEIGEEPPPSIETLN